MPTKKKQEKPIGKVTHYFSDISVAIIKLAGVLVQGDTINIVGGNDTDFNQKIVSMQVNHAAVKRAKKGISIGLKVKQIARDGYKVYKVKKV